MAKVKHKSTGKIGTLCAVHGITALVLWKDRFGRDQYTATPLSLLETINES